MKIKTVFVFLFLLIFVHSAEQLDHEESDPWRISASEKVTGSTAALTTHKLNHLRRFIYNEFILFLDSLKDTEITSWQLERCEKKERIFSAVLSSRISTKKLFFPKIQMQIGLLSLEDSLRLCNSLPLGPINKVIAQLKKSGGAS